MEDVHSQVKVQLIIISLISDIFHEFFLIFPQNLRKILRNKKSSSYFGPLTVDFISKLDHFGLEIFEFFFMFICYFCFVLVAV